MCSGILNILRESANRIMTGLSLSAKIQWIVQAPANQQSFTWDAYCAGESPANFFTVYRMSDGEKYGQDTIVGLTGNIHPLLPIGD
jgi:hypothetical protein